jgi:hypothetical protein
MSRRASGGRHRRRSRAGRAMGVGAPLAVGAAVAGVALVGTSVDGGPWAGTGDAPAQDGRHRGALLTFPGPSATATAAPAASSGGGTYGATSAGTPRAARPSLRAVEGPARSSKKPGRSAARPSAPPSASPPARPSEPPSGAPENPPAGPNPPSLPSLPLPGLSVPPLL